MANGCIRVYSGLMDMMTDNEVEAVIGHEMGHVALGHVKKGMQVALGTNAVRVAAASQHHDNFRKTLLPRFRYTVHLNSTNIRQTMTDLIQRPRRLRKSPALRAMFEETTLSLNDLVLPIFVEEEIDDYKAVEAMPGVMRIPEKHLAREIERIANAGIRSVMTFGISHHTDETGSDAWREDGLVARMSRICKQTVPEMIVMSDTCFCDVRSGAGRLDWRSGGALSGETLHHAERYSG